MLQVNCPFCGPRDHDEFEYGGDAAPSRPAPDAPLQAWLDYVYIRSNPEGLREELWFHAHGCGTWFAAARHMTTHEASS
jgi:sarcosine oxidase subunit delta